MDTTQVTRQRAQPATRIAAIGGLPVTAVLLGVLALTAGLGAAGWTTGLVTGGAAAALIAGARLRSDSRQLLPADWITLARAILSAGVAALAADSLSRPVSVPALVTLAAVALVLDGADGQVARRTGTATPLGGRLDGEVDAFLILALSVAVSGELGSWVLVIGAARYLLLIAGRAVPWLAAPLPPRYWRKVVTAAAGIALTLAFSGLVSRLAAVIAVAVALVLLAESFGRDVIWLYKTHAGVAARRTLAVIAAVAAFAVVWADLLVPDKLWQLSGGAFLRIPVELLVLVALALVLPARPRRIVALVAGIAFGLLTITTVVNIAFYEFVDRSFNPVYDWSNITPAIGVVRDSIGPAETGLLLAGLALALVLVVAVITVATLRVAAVVARHRARAARGLAAGAAVWAVCAGLSLQLLPGFPLASTSASGLAVTQVSATREAFADGPHFEQVIAKPDPEASVPAADLLAGLRGKDVIVDFVESYGQVAIQGGSFSAAVDATLRRQNTALTRAGFAAQSAWVTAPSYGGISQLAHSTLQSGLWVNSRQRYNELIASQRFTLSDAFSKAGWRTVSDSPEDGPSWPPGTSFYHFDQLYNRDNVGYQGPAFSYASMPDQYTYAAFQRNELGPGHQPVFAEIDTVSSHDPWTPLPVMVPWNKVGNGSIFDPMPAAGDSTLAVESNPPAERAAFGKSIQYALTALTSWVTQAADPNLVVVVLGDEQPAAPITRGGASHALPITIIAKDPAVFRQISSWHWTSGLIPARRAPLLKMNNFRNQFLDAFSAGSPQTTAARKS